MTNSFSGPVVLLGATGFLGQAIEAALKRSSATVYGFSSKTLNLTDRAAFGVLDPLAGVLRQRVEVGRLDG